MKESIMIVQQKWGFLFTQNLNYSNSGESSLTAQFPNCEVCGNFRNIVTPHPDANLILPQLIKETFLGNPEYLHNLFLDHFVIRFEKVSSKSLPCFEKILSFPRQIGSHPTEDIK